VRLSRLRRGEDADGSPLGHAWHDLAQAVPPVTTADRTLSSEALHQLAEDGDADAQYRLALRYRLGQSGAHRDMAAAVHWLTRAAEQGQGDAMRMLAGLYAQGSDSIAADARTADYWNERAKAVVR
jgi:TPR repeat protein